jgi:hypothetical protein
VSLLPLFFSDPIPDPSAPDPVPMSTYWRIEVALTTAPYATSDTWTDITSQVRSLRYTARRGAPGDPSVPATASIEVDNRDGRWNASSTYASSPYAGNVVPNKRVRLSFREDGEAAWAPFTILYLERVADSAGPFDAIAVLECSDLFRVLAQSQPVNITRPAELPGPRIRALLDAAGLPAHLRSTIDNGTVMLAPADLSGQVLGLIHEVARAEIAYYLSDSIGRFLFLDRYHWIDNAALRTSQATFDEAEFRHIDVSSISGAFMHTSRVVGSGASGAEKSYASLNTPSNFPPTVHQELSLPLLYDGDVEAHAEAWQKQHETVDIDESRPQAIELFVASPSGTNPGALLEIVNGGVAPVSLTTYVSLTYRPVGWSSDRTAEVRVEAYEHVVTPEEWVWRLGFSAVDSIWLAQVDNHFYTYGATITSDKRGSI